MAIKTYSGAASVEAGVPNTKLRAEQMKSEDNFTSLAVDLEALRGQVKDIIGSADYKEEITGEYAKVQIVDLAAHIDASGASSLSVKQAANVVGAFSVNTDKLTVAAATGNTAIKGTLDVDGQATLASLNVEDLTSGRVVFAGASGELTDASGLTWDGSDLVAASAKVSDLTSGRVVYAGASGALVDSSEMTFGAGGLTLVKDLAARSGSFSGDVTIVGDLLVQGNTVTVDVGTLLIEDKSVVIAKAATGAALDGAGIFLGDESGESIQWNHADTKWIASDKFKADEFEGANLTASRLAYSDADKVIQSVATLSSWVAGTANQVTVTDDGGASPDGTITLSLPQSIHTDADVEFDSLKLGDLTDNRLLKTDPSTKLLVSAGIMDFVTGTLNQVNLTAGAFGNVVLSTPQDIHSAASPQFAKVFIDGAGASDAFIDTDGADMLVLGYRDAAGTGAVSLPVAQAGSYTLSGFTATSIVGALNELKSVASSASKKAIFTVPAGAAISAATDIAASFTWPGGTSFIGELTGQNSLVFVNGMLMLAGGSDFTLNAGAGTLSFTFALQPGDVVVVQKA